MWAIYIAHFLKLYVANENYKSFTLQLNKDNNNLRSKIKYSFNMI